MGSQVLTHPAVAKLNDVRDEIGKLIVGQRSVVDGILICLLGGGHVLLEGVPGLGKTTLLKTLARALHLQNSRIQFTPDLMPADILGSMVIESDLSGHKSLRFQKGPIFSNLVLADEINRATPKTQSALLEAMQERTVTIGNTTHRLEPPFLVMATQNPIESEGTYPLPEAQLDRFLMKIVVDFPTEDELALIVQRTLAKEEIRISTILNKEQVLELREITHDVVIAPHVSDFAVRLVMSTQPNSPRAHAMTKRFLRFGSSPRGAQALLESGRVMALLNGRFHVSTNDLSAVALPVLRHRVILNFDAHSAGQTADTILQTIVNDQKAQTRS